MARPSPAAQFSGRSIATPYAVDQKMKIGVKFSGKDVEFSVNGELMGKCQRKAVPAQMGLTLRGGDDWSAGTTRFGNFKISANKQ